MIHPAVTKDIGGIYLFKIHSMDLSGVIPPTDIGTVLKRNNYIITSYIMYRAFLCTCQLQLFLLPFFIKIFLYRIKGFVQQKPL